MIPNRLAPELSLGYRVRVVVPHRSGPKELLVLCDTPRQAADVARAEQGKTSNQRTGSIVTVEAEVGRDLRTDAQTWKTLVVWTFSGDWRKELR